MTDGIQNTIAPAPSRFHNHSVAALYRAAVQLKHQTDLLKAEKAEIDAELDRRFGTAVTDFYKTKGKATGQVRVPILDGYALEANIEQKVSWDNDGLMAIASGMPWDKASKLFKIKFEMPEAIYKALTEDTLIAAVNKARTVTIASAPTLKLLPPKEEPKS